MTDRKNESLSALCDGECDELEVRRVLNQFSSDPDLREQWRRYHLLGSIMREEPVSSIDLSEGIMQALDGEPMDEVPARSQTPVETSIAHTAADNKRSRSQWLMSSAVAASVTLAVLVGARFAYDPSALDGSMSGAALVMNDSQSAMESEAISAITVAANEPVVEPLTVANADVSAEELRKAQEVLSQYVLEHENEAINTNEQGLPTFVRVANFGADNKTAVRKD
jgi:sigma-E factor negative regulatory protein RseA